MNQHVESSDTDIAVVGMAGRFPGARSPAQLWANVRAGVESIRPLGDAELRAAGVDPALLADPQYVRACAPLDDLEQFDAGFFGFSPREAAILDPQHRHFLECAWEALESAGHMPERFPGAIGVFGGCGMNGYFMFNLLTNPALVRSVGMFLLRHTGNDKDFLTTRVSYLFNLTGPSLGVQTACSTSLVAIHLAAQHLLSGECDLALAGGVTIELPHRVGYRYEDGEILSPDGHCRAFDAASKGTVFGSGVGVVALRRLSDALEDGDVVHAVIKGSAVNNDGTTKVGYLAPSVDGQSASILEALAIAGLSADDISYVETHGTGTPVGDPIEIAALTQAFRQTTTRSGYCSIGSLKTNIGHLDTAAGVASFIKVVEALKHREMPPSLHFKTPNPAIDFAHTPFRVNAALTPWTSSNGPRRAGVSALGVGGTNAHVILEEAPERGPAAPGRAYDVLLLSARTGQSLDRLSDRYAAHFRETAGLSLTDAAYTTAVGRRAFTQRRAVVARSCEDAAAALQAPDGRLTGVAPKEGAAASVVMMFPGGGVQYPNAGKDLFDTEPVFRDAINRCLSIASRLGHSDLRGLMFPTADAIDRAAAALERPDKSILAVFTIEYALAQLWISWGVQPAAYIGHSLGEYVAACLAGVMPVESALAIVAKRGEIFLRMPEGRMLSIARGEQAVRELTLPPDVSIAAVNAPELTVVSGTVESIAALHDTLTRMDIEARPLHIAVAAHSPMLDPFLDEFRRFVSAIPLRPATLPFISNLTGNWCDSQEVATADYWTRHLRGTVRFSQGLETVLGGGHRCLVEAGPGHTLTMLARQHRVDGRVPTATASLRGGRDDHVSDVRTVLEGLGVLWTQGATIDWAAFYGGQSRRRVALPTYAFDHETHWIAPGVMREVASTQSDAIAGEAPEIAPLGDLARWTYGWRWTPQPELPASANAPAGTARSVLLLADRDRHDRFADALTAALRQRGHQVHRVSPREEAAAPNASRKVSRWLDPDAYEPILSALDAQGQWPGLVVCLTGAIAPPALVNPNTASAPDATLRRSVDEAVDAAYHAPLSLLMAMSAHDAERPIEVVAITAGLFPADAIEPDGAAAALSLGPVMVAAHEIAGWRGRAIDLPSVALAPALSADQARAWADRLANELDRVDAQPLVAVRADTTFVRESEPRPLSTLATQPAFRDGGAYLITGGAGGMGLAIASYLIDRYGAKVALVSRAASSAASRQPLAQWSADRRDRVLLLDADVTSAEALGGAIAAAERAFGTVHGVIHAAGVIDDSLIALKSRESSARVLAPKVLGTFALDRALSDRALDFLVLCSSTSAELALPGQADYTAANAFLNAFATARTQSGRGRTLAIEWGTWRDVGMAARTLAASQSTPESTHGGAAKAVSPGAVAESASREAHPLLGTRVPAPEAGAIAWQRQLRHDSTWLLTEHRVRDRGVLPGTAYVELLRAVCGDLTQASAVDITNLTFIAPFGLSAGESRRFRVTARPLVGSQWDVEIESAAANTEGPWEEHARATISPVAAPGAIAAGDGHREPFDLVRQRARAAPPIAPGGAFDVASRQGAHLAFGPRWQVVRQATLGTREVVAALALDPMFHGDFGNVPAHPALLDFATAIGLAASRGYEHSTDLYVPLAYRRIRIGSLMRAAWSHSRVTSEPDDHSVALDVDIYDANGDVLAHVEELVMRRVAPEALALAATVTASHAGPHGRAHAAHGGDLLASIVSAGISPERGPEALDRVLRSDLGPVVVVSSIDFAVLCQAARTSFATPVAAAARSAGTSRPAAEAFADPIEQAVAEVWQDVLGISNVGLDDDFMDLGGHSLMAVRVATRLQRRFGGGLKLAALLEARTIRALAGLVRTMTGGLPAASTTTRTSPGPAPLVAVSREAFRVSRASLITDD
jgi:acyl transferase domain-containing protein/acyl carrier protein